MNKRKLELKGNNTTPPTWKNYYPLYATNALTQVNTSVPYATQPVLDDYHVEEAKNDVDDHHM